MVTSKDQALCREQLIEVNTSAGTESSCHLERLGWTALQWNDKEAEPGYETENRPCNYEA